MVARWTWALLILAASGCGADEVQPAPPPLPGELCNSPVGQCVADDEALVCVDRVWTVERCHEHCAAEGRISLGCDLRLGRCDCTQPLSSDAGASGNCVAGEMHCWGPETLLVCGAEQAWEERTCSELCAAMQPPRLSAGCYHSFEDSCRCTLENTACTDQPARCDDDETVLRCTAGRWTVEYCAEFCDTGGWSACSAWASEEGAGCACSAI